MLSQNHSTRSSSRKSSRHPPVRSTFPNAPQSSSLHNLHLPPPTPQTKPKVVMNDTATVPIVADNVPLLVWTGSLAEPTFANNNNANSSRSGGKTVKTRASTSRGAADGNFGRKLAETDQVPVNNNFSEITNLIDSDSGKSKFGCSPAVSDGPSAVQLTKPGCGVPSAPEPVIANKCSNARNFGKSVGGKTPKIVTKSIMNYKDQYQFRHPAIVQSFSLSPAGDSTTTKKIINNDKSGSNQEKNNIRPSLSPGRRAGASRIRNIYHPVVKHPTTPAAAASVNNIILPPKSVKSASAQKRNINTIPPKSATLKRRSGGCSDGGSLLGSEEEAWLVSAVSRLDASNLPVPPALVIGVARQFAVRHQQDDPDRGLMTMAQAMHRFNWAWWQGFKERHRVALITPVADVHNLAAMDVFSAGAL